MKNFKLLTGKIAVEGFDLTNDLIEQIFVFCEQYNEYIEFCKNSYLEENPEVSPESEYAYPIPYYEFAKEYPHGKLWHGGYDYYEDHDKWFHYVFFDLDFDEDEYVYILIEEKENGGFEIFSIERQRDVPHL